MKFIKIKKAVLIEPGSDFHLFSYTKMPLLGLPILGAILEKMGIKVKIFCENISPINWEEIKNADLIGLTALTTLAPRAYEIIERVRKINPDCKIIMGGVHVTSRPEEALENGVDFAVRNEGEKTLKKLVNCLRNNSNLKEIKGLSFKKNGQIYHNPGRKDFQELDELPTPDFSLIEGYKKLKFVPIQTSRGCPHNCEFCSVVQMFGRKIRYRSSKKVIKDLNKMNQFFNLNRKHIFFVDDNFSANTKRTKHLLNRLDKTNLDLNWSTQEEVNVYKKEEILDLMKKTGCDRLYIGIESFDESSLKEYEKPQNLEDIEKAISTIHQRDILIHGMFVIGADSDTKSSIIKTVKSTVENNIDTAQFFILIPLPGTRIFQKLKEEDRILANKVKKWDLFDGHHVVFQPKNLSPHELQQLQLKAFKHFYNIKNSFGWLWKKKFKNFISTLYGRWAIRKWKSNNTDYLKSLQKSYK